MVHMPDHGSDVLAHVAGNLRRLRQERGLSQATLAERSGISRRTIINLEAGEANISLSGLPARTDAQLWTWALAAGDRYDAEPDPAGWHEIVFVTAGRLRIEREDGVSELGADEHAIYPSAQRYSYVPVGAETARFVRLVVS